MLNILVPTDFSKLSKVAIRYALDMAKKMKGKVTLLHIIDVTDHASSMRLRLSSLLSELRKISEEDFEELMLEVNAYNKTGRPVRYKIEQGSSFVKAVSKFAKKTRANLIVMGTHGASGLKKVVMGSNTATMLEHSGVTVLAVPSGAVFRSLKSVVYATDLENTQKELKKILSIVKSENPLIHIIHVVSDRKSGSAAEEMIDEVVGKVGYKNALVRVLTNTDPVPAINEYVVKIRVDLLAMFPHQYTFFERLVKRSVTKQLTYHNSVPLLAFKKNAR